MDFNTLHLLWAIRDIPSSILSSQEKLILLMLLACAGSNNNSWHSQLSLAEMTSTSESSIKRSVKKLLLKKMIIVTQPAVHGRKITNSYSLNLETIMQYSNLQKGVHHDHLSTEKGFTMNGKGFTMNCERGSQWPIKKEREERNKERNFSNSEKPNQKPVETIEETLQRLKQQFN